MRSQFIEVTVQDGEIIEHNRYMVAQFIGFEWDRPSRSEDQSGLLALSGWDVHDLLVVDLDSGDGWRVRPTVGLAWRFESLAAYNTFVDWLCKHDMNQDLPVMLHFVGGVVVDSFYGYKIKKNASQGGKYGKHRREVPAGKFYQAQTRGISQTDTRHAARSDDYRALCGTMVASPTPTSPEFDRNAANACKRCATAVGRVMVGRSAKRRA